MKKIFVGIIIGGLIFCGVNYAKKIETPIKFTDLTVSNELVNLNTYLELVRDILNGDFTLKVESSVPTWIGGEGDIRAYSSGGVFKIYIYLNGGWRAWTSD